jgi:hypothetical protein
MKTIAKIFVPVAVLILAAGCGRTNLQKSVKADDSPVQMTGEVATTIPEGVYEGVFTVRYSEELGYGEWSVQSGPVTVTLQEGSYSSTGNANRIPARTEGTYTVDEEAGTITFMSEGFYTADFDWNTILGGTYTYTIQGDNLTFGAEKGNGNGYYEYVLVKK